MVEPFDAICDEVASRLHAAFESLDRELLAAKGSEHRSPGAGAWSPAQIGQHVALTNRFLFVLVDKIATKGKKRLQASAIPDEVPNFNVLERLASRELRWTHPAHMSPGHDANVEEARAQLDLDRRRALELLEAGRDGSGSLHRIRMSVVEGDDRLDLYQYLMVIALHTERHAAQVRRARLTRLAPDRESP